MFDHAVIHIIIIIIIIVNNTVCLTRHPNRAVKNESY